MAKKKFIDLNENQRVELQEAAEGKPRRVRYREAMTADIVNGNGRRYSRSVLEAAVAELRNHLNESAGQGRYVQVLGEAEHPSDKPTGRPNLLETVVKWEEVSFDGEHVGIVGRILETSKGQDFLKLMEGGVMPGVSMRGYGEGKTIKTSEGDKIFEVSELHITGFDPVLNPSFENVAEWTESQSNKNLSSLEDEMTDDLEAKLNESKSAQAELAKKLEEANRVAEESRKALEESKNKQAVADAIEEACKDLPFGEKLNGMFVEALRGGEYANADAVKKFAENKRTEYGKLAAAGVLNGLGFNEKTKTVQVLGDVLERETGVPEFARASFELNESLRKQEMRPMTDLRKREDRASVFTQQLLARFDEQNKAHLMRESSLLNEASTTSDINLPYSVSRAIIAEAFPSLVALNVFDVGLMNSQSERIYYEAFAGETGYSVTITDEVVTGGAEGTWYDLTYKNLVPGSVTVTSNPSGTTYTEGTDFILDYELGKIWFLDAGSIGANDILIDYTYHATRKGENAEIERAKTTMSYQTITAAADRLADYVTDEVIKFASSQLNWSATTRMMSNLIRQMRLDKDKALIEKAVMAALSVASNSGGTWDISDANYGDLVAKLGAASVLVANRYYEPTAILCSVTNADRLSNWDGLKRDGFPNALMTAAGFRGLSVKGLPVFATTQMRDNWFLVLNREVVMHRVYSPMSVKGPYPIYSNGKLIAGEQYYAEEYNASIAPVGGKAAYVLTQA